LQVGRSQVTAAVPHAPPPHLVPVLRQLIGDVFGQAYGLSQYLRGLALAGLPPDLERAVQAVTDLEFVLAVRDQFAPLLMRGVYWEPATAYAALGQDDRVAESAEPRDGARMLSGTDWANAVDGFRMNMPALLRPEPGLLVAQGYDFGDCAFIITGEGVIAIDAGTAEHRVRAALIAEPTALTVGGTELLLYPTTGARPPTL
jgi:hypothetical protein